MRRSPLAPGMLAPGIGAKFRAVGVAQQYSVQCPTRVLFEREAAVWRLYAHVNSNRQTFSTLPQRSQTIFEDSRRRADNKVQIARVICARLSASEFKPNAPTRSPLRCEIAPSFIHLPKSPQSRGSRHTP